MQPPSRRLSAMLAAAALLPAGCCNLAMLFCGPDKSAWISVSYRDPEAALATFLEAIRRDRLKVICESLSDGFLDRYGIPGRFEAAVAWQKLKQQVTGIHLLGSADVSPPETLSRNRVRHLLTVSGYRFRIELRRMAFVEVRYSVNGAAAKVSQYVDALAPHLAVEQGDLGAHARVRLLEMLDLPDAVGVADIVAVSAEHEWKVDALDPVEESE